MIQAILTDIEGTTTDIDFVHRTLFPYAAAALGDFLRAEGGTPVVAKALAEAAEQAGKSGATAEELEPILQEWMRLDLKLTPLKQLQGLIWEDGYRRGRFMGHLYPDVPPALHRWRDQGLRLYVYSSGSEHAQRLLFGHSTHGDLSGLFDGYFDTRVGPKREPESYTRICAQTGIEPDGLLFLSDVAAELNAAEAAGLETCLLQRGAAQPCSERPAARDFNEIPQLRHSKGPSA
ncbi:MAG: acireductone synthase [Pseudomonadota bacterium]|nr:acireductone synthase [Pseudomonadota bacterium]